MDLVEDKFLCGLGKIYIGGSTQHIWCLAMFLGSVFPIKHSSVDICMSYSCIWGTLSPTPTLFAKCFTYSLRKGTRPQSVRNHQIKQYNK